MIKLLLVDDHELVREGLRRILAEAPGMEVVGEASSGEEAIDLARSLKPDVVIMDVSMPGIGGLETTRRLSHIDPDIKVIVVTVHVDEPYPTRLLEAGAAGYLTKSCAVDEIIDAIKAVSRGGRYIGTDIARQLALNMLPGGGNQSPFEKLSQREMQVMLMVTKGHSIREISDRLCLSPKTVSTYRYRLYDKLGVSNDVELTHLAMRYGIIDVEQPSAES
ncbi:MAG TPA: two-component system response regulator UvrY [Thiotrichales bacterium]|nr:two-component system response regulator UvrY [Thiotrichales bacterium]